MLKQQNEMSILLLILLRAVMALKTTAFTSQADKQRNIYNFLETCIFMFRKAIGLAMDLRDVKFKLSHS